MGGVIRVTIRREDPLGERALQDQTYEIQTSRDMTVLEILQNIHARLDSTLAFRQYRCGRRLCGSCEVKVDGKVVRGCATLLQPGKTYRLEPARQDSLIRDLVCDFDLHLEVDRK